MDEEKLRKEIAQWKDTSSRKEISSIYEEIILRFHQYQQEQLADIREQVRQSAEQELFDYAVEMFVCEDTQVSRYEEFYEPLLTTGIVMKEWGIGTIETIYLEADDDFLKVRTGKGHCYQARIRTNFDTYPVVVTLRKHREGLRKAEAFHRLLIENAVDSPALNEGHLHKFYDVVFEEVKDRFRPGETVEEVFLSLKELDAFVRRGVVLLWNVKAVSVKEHTFPVPVGTELKYRHEIQLPHDKNAYLLDFPGEILLQKHRKGKQLWVTTTEQNYRTWNLYEITQGTKRMAQQEGHFVISNRMKKNLFSDLLGSQGAVRYTWGELYRRIMSYEAAELFTKIVVRQGERTQDVEVLFYPAKEGFYLNQDAVGFIVKDVSELYHRCRITGRLVESNE